MALPQGGEHQRSTKPLAVADWGCVTSIHSQCGHASLCLQASQSTSRFRRNPPAERRQIENLLAEIMRNGGSETARRRQPAIERGGRRNLRLPIPPNCPPLPRHRCARAAGLLRSQPGLSPSIGSGPAESKPPCCCRTMAASLRIVTKNFRAPIVDSCLRVVIVRTGITFVPSPLLVCFPRRNRQAS